MVPSRPTIAVSAKVKTLLERAKGDKDWDTFLQELLSEWKDSRDTSKAPPLPGAGQPALEHALGMVLDVMKPWSMKITAEGVQLEEIPHSETRNEGEEPAKDGTQVNCPLPQDIYSGWSTEVKDSEAPPKESSAPPKTTKTRARRTTKKKSTRRSTSEA
jgi:hypothetical protein